jgi:YYY domain-containing protein
MMESGLPVSGTDSLQTAARRARLDWLWDVLLIVILLVGVYFRFVGLDWDQEQHLHPDERFLTMVETSIAPVNSLAQYFDTATSTLNPHNRGYGFYVYGTLPLFIVRYAGEWLGKTGYDEIHLVGRQLSSIMDLGTVLMVYLIATRLYRNRRLSLLAAAFASFSVLPIQLSHYFTVDTFTNFFGMLAFYFAMLLLPERKGVGESRAASLQPPLANLEGVAEKAEDEAEADETPFGEAAAHKDPLTGWLTEEWESVIPYILFGAALGMAMACKINAVLLAALLPGAVLVRWISQPREERERWIPIYLRNLFVAAVVSVILFRIFQPYAFSGPGFFGVTPNPKWMQNMRDLAAQSTGDVDFPPALQWARRPITFALQNMVIWGLGLPLGILAWAGFLWMMVRMLRCYRDPRGEWNQHLILWGWTGVYFAYQSYNWTRSMRYQMLVYPTLAIIAAWAVFALWESQREVRWKLARVPWLRICAVVAGLGVLGLTFAWAWAFTCIYTRPVTRVAASRWIYQNVPGPINLKVDTGSGQATQPVAFGSGYRLETETGPMVLAFHPRQSGLLTSIAFEHLGSVDTDPGYKTISVTIGQSPDDPNPLAVTNLSDEFIPESDPRGKNYTATFEQPVRVTTDKTYYLTLLLPGMTPHSLQVAGPIVSTILTEHGLISQSLPEPVDALRAGKWYQISFQAIKPGILRQVALDHVVDWEGRPETKTLRVSIIDSNGTSQLASGEVKSAFSAPKDIRGEAYTVQLEQPVELRADHVYSVRLEVVDGPGALALYGSKQANESSWDDALPVGLDGYNPYDYNQGVYRSDLNFEMYWDDNPEKLSRFLSVLDQADYIFISSNRQWGTTTRVPERYPLTSTYYRQLLGCPADKEITWCYSVAQPGMFRGNLGYELESVFQSDPNLGSLRFNSQFAEEAFTVYDAPKVLIFKKTAAYNPDTVQTILGSVDLSTVMHVTPRKATGYPANLMLPASRLAEQIAGGTWADLFHPDALYNRFPGLGAVIWYLVIALLGWVMYPFTRLALHGLPDRGYPLARLVGMLALAYPVWLLGSASVPFTPLTITLVFAVLLLVNLGLAYTQRQVLLKELRERWKYILLVELLFLGFFLLFLLVRLGNPDLWHPYKGGEKPMDFSYFNAVLKSTTFPPYNPWFAGSYINYYYYGFVIVGVPVKWLGIVPAIAYNLILPTMFAMLAMGAFSIGWNLLAATRRRWEPQPGEPVFDDESVFERRGSLLAGLMAALASVFLGNLGTVRMIWHGVQRLADMQGIQFEKASFFTHIAWTFAGLGKWITHPGPLPFYPGDWYWIPSRAYSVGRTVSVQDITEFPAFTFLYGDPHAHLFALPVTVLALAWALSVLLGRWGWKSWGHLGISFLLGGLAIGTLRPTNTWDWPTYLAIGCVTVLYTALRYGQACCLQLPGVTPKQKRVLIAIVGVVVLSGLSLLLFKPFTDWYGQGYTKFILWKNYRTPFWSYLVHWGTFLFIIVSWMTWETIDWMATTPVSALNKLRPYKGLIQGGVIVLVLLVIGLLFNRVEIAWLVLPLILWAGVLLLRPNMPDTKRAVLFMTGTALFLTLFVEVFVLEGDLDRMNTIFKFYLQAWTLLAASAGASLIWLLPAVREAWRPGWRHAWQPILVTLLIGTALFPIMAGTDKIRDRMAENAPHTLDGMAYMNYSTYTEGDKEIDLSQDYRAIEWMQRNVKGSPVIVEANTPEYRWGTRYTIYTGLPGVVGWNWHQRQQRAVTPDTWVFDRVDAVGEFYNTGIRSQAEDFLRRFSVKYIVVGQLERALYTPDGLQKFADWNGNLWHEVYRDGQTVIYEVAQ